MKKNIPEKFKEYLGGYGEQIYDSNCGEPIGWGHMITRHLGENLWGELSQYGDMHCCYPNWFLITKWLTREEAKKKYGPDKEELGPRGGFKSLTFGDKTFSSRKLLQ